MAWKTLDARALMPRFMYALSYDFGFTGAPFAYVSPVMVINQGPSGQRNELCQHL